MSTPVHPRERGEHDEVVPLEAHDGRFIPASAGNTGMSDTHTVEVDGSSPRARGTPSMVIFANA